MTSRIDLKRGFLAALTATAVVFALVLVAGGSPASAEDVDSWPIFRANQARFWEDWGANTHTPGEDDWACVKDDEGSEEAFVIGNPPSGSVWRLIVVKAGSEVNDLHWNPLPGDSFNHSRQGGWSHVILCSRPFTDPTTTTTLPEVTTTLPEVTTTLPEVTTTTTIPDEVSPTSIVSTTTTTEPPTTTTTIKDEVSPTSIVSTTTSIVSTTAEVSPETLPFTGFENGTSGLLALMLVASGALALVGTRVFRKETDE